MDESDLFEIRKAHGLPKEATIADICAHARQLRQTETSVSCLMGFYQGMDRARHAAAQMGKEAGPCTR